MLIYICKSRLSSPSDARYIRTVNHGNSGTFTLYMEAKYSFETWALTKSKCRHIVPDDSIHRCYSRESIKTVIIVSSGRLIITFDEATAGKLYLQGTRHINVDTDARGTFLRPPLGISSLKAKGTRECITLNMEAICCSEISVPKCTKRHHHFSEDNIFHC
jgi:hypothetical protein